MTATDTSRRQHADVPQIPTDSLKPFVEMRLRRNETPTQIAAAARIQLGIEIDRDQVIPYWKGEIACPTQTGRRQDKESTQFPEDEAQEPLFTRMPDGDALGEAIGEPSGETPGAVSGATAPAPFSIAPHSAQVRGGACGDDAPATQTGHGQDASSLQIPADRVDAPRVTREAHAEMIEALAAQAKVNLGIAPGLAKVSAGARTEDAQATQTGRRPDQKTMSILTDEVKAFIVRGLARYETPTRVAASVKAQFGVEIDRRQVFAYDPAGSRPPAQRWIDLHAATRAKFLCATAEIGVAQKVVRLRMLDRYANLADEANYTDRAAAFLAQAAKECGGFYERFARPKIAAASASSPKEIERSAATVSP